MFVPSGYHIDASIGGRSKPPTEDGSPSFSYPAGMGQVLMNGCFGTGYTENDPCFSADATSVSCKVSFLLSNDIYDNFHPSNIFARLQLHGQNVLPDRICPN